MQVARPFGVPLKIHHLLPIYLAAIGFVTLNSSGLIEARDVLAGLCLLFACVTLHEFGHVLAAARFGIATRSVTLYPFGGLAQLEGMPERPAHEIVVALGGPAVNVVLALGGWLAGGRLPWEDGASGGALDHFVSINVGLTLFNLVPAFPMDGGRVLRALMAFVLTRRVATAIAISLGQALALFMAWIGWTVGEPMLVIISIFVFVVGPAESGRGPFWFLGSLRRRLMGAKPQPREA